MLKFKKFLNRVFDIIFSPLTFLAAKWFRFIQNRGIYQFKVSEKIFMNAGVYPVSDHYYNPMINPRKHLRHSLRDDRSLPGIDMNVRGQLQLLSGFTYSSELKQIPANDPDNGTISFFYDNGWFDRGDAEILYSLVRHFKPKRIIEIGSGKSTLMSLNAIGRNKLDDPSYQCKVTCVEPYEQDWLEKKNIEVVRKRVEELDITLFDSLDDNDILFIDSSHIIRPQGDILFEFLEVLPRLKKKVVVHVHDIFLPKDYPDQWIINSHSFWNEQYLLEAFLSMNKEYEVLLALNYLFHHHRRELDTACPMLAEKAAMEPRSFWMRKL